MIISLPLLPIVLFDNGTDQGFLTEHNRSELSISYEEKGNTQRNASGQLRGYFVSDARTWSLNWNMTPASSQVTVDGFWSMIELEDFYRNSPGKVFTAKFYNRSNAIDIADPLEEVRCRFTEFGGAVVKRGVRLPDGGVTDMCNFSCSWTEIN